MATSFEHDPWPAFIGGNLTVSGAGLILARTDWQRGKVLVDDEPDRVWGHCDQRAGLIYAPYHKRGRVGLRIIDEHSGETRSEHEWPRRGVCALSVLTGPNTLAVNTNAQGLSLIGPDGLPAWTTNAPPYPYDIAAYPEGPIYVGTAGKGGYLLALDRESGDELVRIKPRAQGVSHVHLWTQRGLVAGDAVNAPLILDSSTLEHAAIDVDSLRFIATTHIACHRLRTDGMTTVVFVHV